MQISNEIHLNVIYIFVLYSMISTVGMGNTSESSYGFQSAACKIKEKKKINNIIGKKKHRAIFYLISLVMMWLRRGRMVGGTVREMMSNTKTGRHSEVWWLGVRTKHHSSVTPSELCDLCCSAMWKGHFYMALAMFTFYI